MATDHNKANPIQDGVESSAEETVTHPKKKLKLSPEIRDEIAEYGSKNPSLKQHEIQKWVEERFNVKVSQATISIVLAAKKKASVATGNLTLGQKKAICEESEKDPLKTQDQLATFVKEKFTLSKKPSQATISLVLKRKTEYLKIEDKQEQSVKRKFSPRFPQIETALANWVLQCQSNRIALSGQTVREQARTMARMLNIPEDITPAFSKGWLHKFHKRHNFRHFRSHGEGGSSDLVASEADQECRVFRYGPPPHFDVIYGETNATVGQGSPQRETRLEGDCSCNGDDTASPALTKTRRRRSNVTARDDRCRRKHVTKDDSSRKYSIKSCIMELNKIGDHIVKGSPLYMQALQLFKDANNREIWMALDTAEVRAAWLEFMTKLPTQAYFPTLTSGTSTSTQPFFPTLASSPMATTTTTQPSLPTS